MAAEKEEIMLDDNQLICALTNKIKTASAKEQVLQSVIMMLNEEYDFALSDMERDFSFSYETDEGKKRRIKADLIIFRENAPHDITNAIRFCAVHDSKVKSKDSKKGVHFLYDIFKDIDCDFGLWTNGDDLHFVENTTDIHGNAKIEDIADFPGAGQTMEDLELSGERVKPRKPANDSLIRTFKRCHDYIYGNEGMKKTAFWELLNLIFCKIFDEKRRFTDAEKGKSYRRKFWVGVKEQNSIEGQTEVAKRIKGIFEELKEDKIYREVFTGNEQINLSPRGIAFVASELAKYSFLDATVDVKGMAYETIVSNTLKQEAGQFFTPRNVIRCMVEMLNPDANTRVLDPACGSGGFLVMVLDHVRKQIAANMFQDEPSDIHLEAKYNSTEVNDAVRNYAERMLFGFDFDPDLKKAARMNMVMAGDGHANIFNINSLEYPQGSLEDIPKVAEKVNESIRNSNDRDFDFGNIPENSALGKFDMIFTNPPFGAKVQVDNNISKDYDLGYNLNLDAYGRYTVRGSLKSSEAPEVLFIEQCYRFLKPGGKMAIVLPDGILGNPNTEPVRAWILRYFKLLASVDLPVETFLPQVGVQASLLFLQKKTAEEFLIDPEQENYDVFMAIAEGVGKDRRGVPVYERDDDGAELLFDNRKRWLTTDENGNSKIRSRNERIKRLDDDLPKISKAYKLFLEEGK